MSIVQLTDFNTGKYKLAVNRFTTADVTTFIEQREREYLIRLLGAELYALFIADLTGTPSEPQGARFVAIFDANAWDYDTNEPLISDGIVEMLKGIIFYHYVKDNNAYHTITGLVSNNNENSTPETKDKGMQYITQLYSNALETYSAIQRYISENSSTYPEFNGKVNRQSPFAF
jgi:hypothetical protein